MLRVDGLNDTTKFQASCCCSMSCKLKLKTQIHIENQECEKIHGTRFFPMPTLNGTIFISQIVWIIYCKRKFDQTYKQKDSSKQNIRKLMHGSWSRSLRVFLQIHMFSFYFLVPCLVTDVTFVFFATSTSIIQGVFFPFLQIFCWCKLIILFLIYEKKTTFQPLPNM